MNLDKLAAPPFKITKPLSPDEYQKRAFATDITHLAGKAKNEFPYLGLFGEVGTLLSALKKKQRDGKAYTSYESVVHEEFGDVLWYLSNIASRANLKFNECVSASSGARTKRKKPAFVQPSGSSVNDKEFEAALIELAAEVGSLFVALKKQDDILRNSPQLVLLLTKVYTALANAARASGVKLEKAAINNLKKVYNHHPPHEIRQRLITPLFDRKDSPLEQLPRRIEMVMFEKKRDDKIVMFQQWNGVNIGRTLTDNKQKSDGYRFHDVFHLAFAAVLGWSPTMRALLRVKRKTKAKIDEAEDGQRAGFLEEGLSALIFQHAEGVDYFRGLNRVDYSLLKLIPSFVAGYEVAACALWEWEKAILQGFKVFDKLLAARAGTVIADLDERTITFQELSAKHRKALGIKAN